VELKIEATSGKSEIWVMHVLVPDISLRHCLGLAKKTNTIQRLANNQHTL
jgi:hypothetical protein